MKLYKTKSNYWIRHIRANKYKILTLYSVLLTSFLVFWLLDQVTKTLLFEHGSVLDENAQYINGQLNVQTYNGKRIWAESIWPADPDEWKVVGFIGVRSVWHGGVTFLATRNQFIIQGISLVLHVSILLSPLFSKKMNNIAAFFLGLLLGGVAGNMIDRFMFNTHVKDVFYFTFAKNSGTFNIADLEILIGGVLYALYSLFGGGKKRLSNIQHLVA
ncbi:signal peptidase [Mycoplasmopsis bovirhinis]|nr:signal peptidase [Mycoplasmopsis bovirhinis]